MEGGCRLKKFEDCFKTRMVAIRRHLIRDRKQNHLLENVMEHEKDRIMRIGEQYKRMYTQDEEVKDEKISDKIKIEVNKKDKDEWHAKQHGYLFRKIAEKEDTDYKGSYLWLKKGNLTSHIEGYFCAVQEQEVETKALRKLREKDQEKKSSMDSKCRLCGKNKENIYHIIASCPVFSSNLYLNVRHNPIAKKIYDQVSATDNDNKKKWTHTNKVPPSITKLGSTEIWWDKPTAATSKIPHNRLDMVVWDAGNKTSKITDVCVPLDSNLGLREKTKHDNYIPFVDQLQKLYLNFKYQVIPVVDGTLGTLSTSIKENLKKIGIKEENIQPTIEKIQKLALLGTLKITKSFHKM